MKILSLLIVVSACLAGCGSADSSMNSEETKNFAPPKDAKRDPKATQGIADFKKRFEEKHGGATNMPANASNGA